MTQTTINWFNIKPGSRWVVKGNLKSIVVSVVENPLNNGEIFFNGSGPFDSWAALDYEFIKQARPITDDSVA